MTQIRDSFIAEACLRFGDPYDEHYTGADPCRDENGAVYDSPVCLERGLNTNGEGFDCMGLVIASLARTLEMPTHNWPVDYRHLEQFDPLAENRAGEPGDIVVFYHRLGRPNHMGVLLEPKTIIHATRDSRTVRITKYKTERAKFIAPEAIVDRISST